MWRDERLAFGHWAQAGGDNRNVTLHHKQFDRMWTPDVFIRNLKAGLFHTITVPNRLIRLSPDGTILYSQRLTLTLACDMDLNKYPMDNQTCKIEFGSCESSHRSACFN
jgi:Neurotransmitter-gated ion-channel ligand binding domain